MKPLAAIFLITVFALSQYGKHLAYVQCKLANQVKLSAQQCDCEKKYDIHIKDDQKPAAHQTNFTPPVDEFYFLAASEVSAGCFRFLTAKPVVLPSAGACKGNCLPLYRPPQA